MRIDVLTLFPNMFSGFVSESIIGKAIAANKVGIHFHDFRKHATNKHGHVDDYPFGGGAGMLLQVAPIADTLDDIAHETGKPNTRVVLLDPIGKKFDQAMAEDFAKEDHLIFVCGHYEGYDERIRSYVTDEVSIGDYVLTGGEPGAMVIIDATVRLVDSVVGNEDSIQYDSHSTGLLEGPQYTRPREYKGMTVPETLLSGNHALIATWQKKEALRRTYQRRPDMLESVELDAEMQKLLAEVIAEETSDFEEM